MGQRFWKMSGSGNDFIVFDARAHSVTALENPEAIKALCARGTGIGADGVVFVSNTEHAGAALAMRYYNADGSLGEFCGNATLCITRLATELGLRSDEGLRLETDSGIVPARLRAAHPAIDLPAVTVVSASVDIELEPGERRIGFALAGVPHLVVHCDDVDTVDVETRGRALRHAGFRASGANVNFISRQAGRWSIRTFERGVEGETLACGSGAIASAILLAAWKQSGDQTTLETRSGRPLTVTLEREGERWKPTLEGEGRIVFTGELPDDPAD